MRPYPRYKGSGIEWVGEIPVYWRCLRLEHITNYVNRGKYSQYVDFSEYKIVNQNCIHWEGLRIENVKYISKESWDNLPEALKLRHNDVMVNSTGFGTIGRPGLWQHINGNYTVDGHVTLIRGLGDIHSRYLYYLLATSMYQGLIEKYCITGATKQTDILKTLLSKLKFVVPPQQEQHQITSFLDRKTQQIDELISIKERKIELLGEQRTTLINQAVTKGLDPNVEMKVRC